MKISATRQLPPPLQATASLRGRDDNSFSKATNLGTIRPNRASSFNGRNTVDSKDPVDYYKFTILPGVDSYTSSRYSADGGGIKVSLYTKFGNGSIQPATPAFFTATPASPYTNSDDTFNYGSEPGTFYLKITPLKGKSNYSFFSSFDDF